MAHAALLSKQLRKPKWPLIGYLTVEAAFPLASITMLASKELGNHHTLNIADALLGEDWQRELVATKISLEHPLHHAQMAGAVRKLWASGQIRYVIVILDVHHPTTSSHFFCKARRCGVRLVYLPATFLPPSSMLRKVG